MGKFEVVFVERYIPIIVTAKSKEQAEQIAWEMYEKEKVNLTESNLHSTDVEVRPTRERR